MNSNVYNQTVHSLSFYIPPISSLQNPISDDFERLIEQYQQFFSLL